MFIVGKCSAVVSCFLIWCNFLGFISFFALMIIEKAKEASKLSSSQSDIGVAHTFLCIGFVGPVRLILNPWIWKSPDPDSLRKCKKLYGRHLNNLVIVSESSYLFILFKISVWKGQSSKC